MRQTDAMLMLALLVASAAGCIVLYLGRRLIRRTLHGLMPWLMAALALLLFLAVFAIAIDFSSDRGSRQGNDRSRQQLAAEELAAAMADGGRITLHWRPADAMVRLSSGRTALRIWMDDLEVVATFDQMLRTIFKEVTLPQRVVILDEHGPVPPAPVLGLIEQTFRRQAVRLTVRPITGGAGS